jgi:WAS family protein 1
LLRKDGLGRLPEYLSSVSSLLLFNTSENLYKKYVSLDPLEGKEKEKQKQTDNKNALAAAPISVAEGDKMPILGERSLVFVPGPTQIPEWNLPPDLPDLKVAQLDLSQLKLPEFASIAPSDQIPKDLPVVSGTSTEPLKENVNQPSPATGPVTAASPSPPPPPPPPPPPSTTATTASETTTVASNATVTSEGSKQGDIPTPPPLPSASLAKMNLPPPQEGRERLLESIRQGKKLRPVGERKDVPPKAASKKMPKKAPTVEGIFSELFLALKRRREGIASGKVKVSSSESKKDGESATSADNTAKDTGNTENSQQSENEPKQIKTPLLNAFEKDDDASEKKDDGHNSDWDKEDKQ